MSPKRYTPAEAAAIVGISPNSLRNWCNTFAAYLSDAAKPKSGYERILNDHDVGVLQKVKELRDQKLTYDAIKLELDKMPDSTQLEPYIDIQPVTTVTPVQQPPEAIQSATISADLVQALQSIADSIAETRHDDLQRQIDEIRESSIQRYQGFVLGILVGTVITVLILGLLWAGMSMR